MNNELEFFNYFTIDYLSILETFLKSKINQYKEDPYIDNKGLESLQISHEIVNDLINYKYANYKISDDDVKSFIIKQLYNIDDVYKFITKINKK